MAEETTQPVAPVPQRQQRASDRGVMCTLALRTSQAWDWIDNRQIDAHILTVAIVYGTAEILRWAFAFSAAHPEAAGTIGAVMGPWSLLQASAVKFYFDARK